eukprot:c11095_g1_i1.p1 GENE.c11095_g1_i1~~c11095_g1_i1.p1  ORF type:complete len:422 (+),score=98.23 c11095_g1_i1:75-1340(+)
MENTSRHTSQGTIPSAPTQYLSATPAEVPSLRPLERSDDARVHELCVAASSNNIESARKYIDALTSNNHVQGKSPLDLRSKNGHVALVRACVSGSQNIAEILISAGANVNQFEDLTLSTALHEACSRGDYKVVHWLVTICKADISSRNRYHQTPLLIACEKRSIPIVEFLSIHMDSATENDIWLPMFLRWAALGMFDRSSRQNTLYEVCRGRLLSPPAPTLQSMLRSPSCAVDVQSQSVCHKANIMFAMRSPLHVACSCGRLQEAMALVGVGADCEAASKDDLYTPLHCAARGGHLQIVRWLIEEVKVSATRRTVKGRTPVEVGVRCGQWAVVMYLEARPEVIVSLTPTQATQALVRACVCGDGATVVMLLQAGADPLQPVVHFAHSVPSTAVGHAMRAGHQHVVRILRDSSKNTPSVTEI